jgi:hypothetical protein
MDKLKELLWLQSLRRLTLWINRGQKPENELLTLPEIVALPRPYWRIEGMGVGRRTSSHIRTGLKTTQSSHI